MKAKMVGDQGRVIAADLKQTMSGLDGVCDNLRHAQPIPILIYSAFCLSTMGTTT